MSSRLATVLILALLSGGAAQARDGDDICADRPSRAAGACTAPAGHLQVEADVVSGTFDRAHGVTTDSWFIANPSVKYGVGPTTDLELQFDPLVALRTHVEGGKDRTAVGPSDLVLRVKQNVFGGNDGDVQAAIVPYVKAPTASHLLGNGAWEGGAYVPITFKIAKVWQLSLTPEFDILKDDAGDARHLQHSQVISISRSLPQDWTVFADIYGQWDFQRHGATQSTLDFAVAKILHHTLQLDAGVNIGLNRATPGLNAYLGVSQRF